MDVTLAWNASTGATGYKIYYKTGKKGPPYRGSSATKNNSSKVFDSPIVIGKSTRATFNLPSEKKYYLVLTAYNKDGESAYSQEVSVVSDLEYSTCKKKKVTAAKYLYIQLLYYHSLIITAPNQYDLDSLVEIAEAKFESSWEKADVCPTSSMEYIDDIIFLAVKKMVRQISYRLDLESQVGRSLGASLLRAMKIKCIDSFNNSMDARFQKRWDLAIASAERRGVMYYGPPSSIIENIIDNLVTDVLAEIL
jgi:hypothetical protein